MPSDDERRRHPRVPADLQVRFRPLDPSELPLLAQALGQSDPPVPDLNLVRTGSRVVQVRSVNLSQGGLLASGDLAVHSERPFAPGSDLVLELDLPDGEPPLRAVAQVMWARQEGGLHQLGLMFLLLPEAGFARVRNYLQRRLDEPA